MKEVFLEKFPEWILSNKNISKMFDFAERVLGTSALSFGYFTAGVYAAKHCYTPEKTGNIKKAKGFGIGEREFLLLEAEAPFEFYSPDDFHDKFGKSIIEKHSMASISEIMLKAMKDGRIPTCIPLPEHIPDPLMRTACLIFFVLGYHFARENPKAVPLEKKEEYSFKPFAIFQG